MEDVVWYGDLLSSLLYCTPLYSIWVESASSIHALSSLYENSVEYSVAKSVQGLVTEQSDQDRLAILNVLRSYRHLYGRLLQFTDLALLPLHCRGWHFCYKRTICNHHFSFLFRMLFLLTSSLLRSYRRNEEMSSYVKTMIRSDMTQWRYLDKH